MTLFELFVKIGVDDQATKGIKDVEKTADKASKGGLANFANKLGNGLKTAVKIGTTALGVATTGITALTTLATKNFAEYEQLVGGAELMFGEAFDYVKARSEEAYKTVQMSQNEYLQQVNSFATGLKTSLGNNEQAAAELADRIITAEADIIAATGNTAENVQNAFNGIMKSNFTMLDNLQIGITPTKEGFQEVIDKVNDWNATNKEATNYQMGNLADMQSALVDYIEMVGMSGYAQMEASKTISGSLASAKSAWSNLMTGLADDSADLDKLIDNFVNSITGYVDESGKEVKGVADNILPVIEKTLEGSIDLIEGLFPKIIDALPDLIETLVPSLIDGAVNIIMALVDGLDENADMLAEVAVDAVFTLVEGLLSMLPEIIDAGLDFIIALADGLTNAIQNDDFIKSVLGIVMRIVGILTNPETLKNLLNTGLDLLLAIVEGLLSEESITTLVDTVFMIYESLVEFFTDPENIGKIIDVGIQLIVALVKGLGMELWRVIESADELTADFWDTITNTDWLGLGKDIMNSIWDGLVDVWNSLVDWFSNEFDWFSGWFNDSTDTGGWSGGGGANKRFIDGSHAGGLSYVPYDGYIAELHEGERVLTASEARRYNNGNGYGGGTSTVNVTVGIDDTANAMGLARALLPFLKIAEKEVYA